MELQPVPLLKSRNLKPLLLPQPGSLLARFSWKPGNFPLGKHDDDGYGLVILFLWLTGAFLCACWAKPLKDGTPELAICLVYLIGMEIGNCEETLIILLYNLWLYTKMIYG